VEENKTREVTKGGRGKRERETWIRKMRRKSFNNHPYSQELQTLI